MRIRALFGGLLIVAMAAPAASASAVMTVGLKPAGPISLSETSTVTVEGTAEFSAPQRTQVFTDKLYDDALLVEATPPVQDLTAGFVAVERDARTLDLTWQVADLPDELGGLPEVVRYMWEFTITPPAGDPATDAMFFAAQAKWSNVVDRARIQSGNLPQTETKGAGKLEGNCERIQNVISCSRIGDPAVTIDAVANQLTIHIPFAMLKAKDGSDLMVDGAIISPAVNFKGIVAIAQAVFSYGAMGDTADIPPAPFMVGPHARIGINPVGLDEVDLAYSNVAAADGKGAFSAEVSLAGLIPGAHEADVRACVDAACGPVHREPVDLVA